MKGSTTQDETVPYNTGRKRGDRSPPLTVEPVCRRQRKSKEFSVWEVETEETGGVR